MSKIGKSENRVTVPQIIAHKAAKQKISMVTCYDSSFARIVDRSPVDIALVGDSVGNVMLGFESTISVTMDHMVHHTAAVSRVCRRVLVCADMPFLSYNCSQEQALKNAGRLIQEGGAQAVKVEGAGSIIPYIASIVANGIPVMGHIGLTPQSVHKLGGYKIQGREHEQAQEMILAAQELAAIGVFAIVVELVPAALTKKISEAVSIPVIGIGAGSDCDGQVLVLQDLLGFDDDFQPKFLKKFASLGQVISNALVDYDREVKTGVFPSTSQSFK